MSGPIEIEIRPRGALWRCASRDGRFAGVFTSRAAARRWACEECESHAGYVVAERRDGRR